MIKRLYLLIFFLLCTVIASAQIQRKILDFTLGVSTKTQVLNYIKSHQYVYHLDEEGNFVVQRIKFAGENWSHARFCFYNEKLYLVSFRHNDRITLKENLDYIWDRLNDSLKKKYSDYIFESEKDSSSYFDNKTFLVFFYKQGLDVWSICLEYYDYKLFQQKDKLEEDEL